ncbi:MAG TPA: hypothetical protein VHG71_08100 [Verrucomicrobiae bacterium]|nr:hypothetical protein [Verrucomicrobiae bacterium]
MKNKIILCLVLILSGELQLKANDTNGADDHFDVVEELHAAEINECFTNYSAITNQDFLTKDFAVRTTDLGWMTAAEYKRLKLTNGTTQISSPFGSKAYSVFWRGDVTKISPDNIVLHVVVFQDCRPKYKFDFQGFADWDADWIDEKLLKIVYWPGTRVRVTELINVETGKIIYRSADGIYDSLKNSLQIRQ